MQQSEFKIPNDESDLNPPKQNEDSPSSTLIKIIICAASLSYIASPFLLRMWHVNTVQQEKLLYYITIIWKYFNQ